MSKIFWIWQHFSCLKIFVKSLPTSLCQREEIEFSPFGNLFPAKGRQRGMKGDFMMILLIN